MMAAFTVLLIGIGIAAYLLGTPLLWIVVGIVVLLALTYVISTSRGEEPPAP
jgi:heme A synthase